MQFPPFWQKSRQEIFVVHKQSAKNVVSKRSVAGICHTIATSGGNRPPSVSLADLRFMITPKLVHCYCDSVRGGVRG